MNWRQPESRTPQARLGTNEFLEGEANEFEIAEEPDTTSQTGRQMNRYMEKQMNSRQPKSQTPPARLEQINSFKENSGEANEFEIAEEADTTSQTGRQMNAHKRRQMNWRQPESRTLPARLGNK